MTRPPAGAGVGQAMASRIAGSLGWRVAVGDGRSEGCGAGLGFAVGLGVGFGVGLGVGVGLRLRIRRLAPLA
jgi:hypothetical protein